MQKRSKAAGLYIKSRGRFACAGAHGILRKAGTGAMAALWLAASGCAVTPETAVGAALDGASAAALRTEVCAALNWVYCAGQDTEYGKWAELSLRLPAGWESHVIPADAQIYGIFGLGFGIEFWPEEDPDCRVFLHFVPIGISTCGTGVTITRLETSRGHWVLQEEQGTWHSVFFEYARDFTAEVIVERDLWEKHKDTIFAILETAQMRAGKL